MKKIFFLAAMLSFLAIYSCQDFVVGVYLFVVWSPVTVEGSYTIGDRSGKITSAYYGISSTGECRFILRPDGLPYSRLPPYDAFLLVISFPEQTPKPQPGSYTMSDDGGIQMAAFAEGTEANAQEYMFKSANAELSETGDYYTLTLSGTIGDDIVSVTYTGPFFEVDFDTLRILGSGSYSVGNFSSSLRYANAVIDDYDESETNLELYICSVPENVNGINRMYEFWFELRFPGEELELQPGTYQETDDVILQSCCSYYDEAGEYQSIDFKTLTLIISEEGTDYQGTDYKIKATGTLADESTVSVDFSGYVTYEYY